MGVGASRFWTHVVLQAVATVKELANITSDVMLENKATTWVLIDELVHVKDILIKNDKLAAIDKSLLEIFGGHTFRRLYERHLFSQQTLVPDFSNDQEREENS